MKPFNHISNKWQQFGQGKVTSRAHVIGLSAADASLLDQLCRRYPRLTREIILRDLLEAALTDFEQSIPYVAGDKVVALDEMGDEIYEDAGITPTFLNLSKAHRERLNQELLVETM